MSPEGQASSQQSTSPRAETSTTTGGESSRTKSDEWSDVKDPNERRKIQNKLAQRRFREYKTKRKPGAAANLAQGTK